jgi:glycosyltransferase involved in cell wall biosynthesis
VSAIFLGSRDDVEEVLPSFDVFVLPSLWEGEPIALLEAMASGLPCVATATSGSREVLSEPGRGVLVPLRDPPAIAAAVAALRSDASRRSSLGAGARAAAELRSWGAAAARLVDVYAEVLARRG